MYEKVRIGTRGSRLALIQTETVKAMIAEALPDVTVEIVVMKTEGDIDRQSPLSQFGGRGAFVRTIETALLENRIDMAVHSLKDLPSHLPEGLVLGASPVREDPRDVLVSTGGTIMDLAPGSVLGTGSERRSTQIAALRPDLVFRDIRGNIETRLNKVGDGYDAVVLAGAALKRLGFGDRITETFDPSALLPAPCQGAIGVECRESDSRTLAIAAAIDNPSVRKCVDLERTFINTLGMGCHTPVGALVVIESETIRFSGYLAQENGAPLIRESLVVPIDQASDEIVTLARRFKARAEGRGEKR